MIKIRDIYDKYRDTGIIIEIWYSSSPRNLLEQNICVEHGYGYNHLPVRDVDIQDLWAYEYEECDEFQYDMHVDQNDIEWELYADGQPIVVVIWLTHLSYRILYDDSSSFMRVADLRLEYIGQYSELVVIKRLARNQYEEDEDEYYPVGDEDDYSSDDYYEVRKKGAEVVSAPRDVLDKMWTDEHYLINENDLREFPYDLDLDWMDEETIEEHYGKADACILVAVLA